MSELYEIKQRLKEIEAIKANLKKDDDLKLLEIETVEPHITKVLATGRINPLGVS